MQLPARYFLTHDAAGVPAQNFDEGISPVPNGLVPMARAIESFEL